MAPKQKLSPVEVNAIIKIAEDDVIEWANRAYAGRPFLKRIQEGVEITARRISSAVLAEMEGFEIHPELKSPAEIRAEIERLEGEMPSQTVIVENAHKIKALKWALGEG